MKYLYVHINNNFSWSTYAIKAISDRHQLKGYFLMTDFDKHGFLESQNSETFLNVPYSFSGKSYKTILQIIRYSLLSTSTLLNFF
jgi:hypothetical protein